MSVKPFLIDATQRAVDCDDFRKLVFGIFATRLIRKSFDAVNNNQMRKIQAAPPIFLICPQRNDMPAPLGMPLQLNNVRERSIFIYFDPIFNGFYALFGRRARI
jgi:hypothetical protein